MTRRAQLAHLCGAYDMRGRTHTDFSDELVTAVGYATHEVMRAQYQSSHVLIGHDMREKSAEFASLLCHGVAQAGGTPVNIGLVSTDQLYFGSGVLNMPGIMVTASHNPADWNGFKVCGPQARGISRQDALGEIVTVAETAEVVVDSAPWPVDRERASELAEQFAQRIHVLTGLADASRPLTVVADAGNGMAGNFLDRVFDCDAVTLVGLFTDLDGTFPNHQANPLDPSTLRDAQEAVRAHGADIGLVFDGDADRCFVIDERGEPTSASAIGALVATREIQRARNLGEDNPAVIHNALTTRAVPQSIKKAGGRSIRTPVGHSGIKQRMRIEDAVFAVEHSAHFYFRDFFCADSGILAACHVIAALRETGRPLSHLLEPFSAGALSGEINSEVECPDRVLERVEAECQAGTFGEGRIDHLDGVTFTAKDFWFNVRKSNTEPLVRFNAESSDPVATRDLTERVLRIIRTA